MKADYQVVFLKWKETAKDNLEFASVVETKLNELAREGWSLVQVVQMGSNGVYLYLRKGQSGVITYED